MPDLSPRRVPLMSARAARPRRLRSAVATAAVSLLALGGSLALESGVAHAAPTGFPDFDAACVALDTSVPSGVEGGATRKNGIDNRLNGYIGGNFIIGTAPSEVEGLYVVAGNLVNNKPSYFGVGVVGAGALISPAAGKDVLLVGGDVSGEASIDTADNLARVGGTVTAGFVGTSSYTDGLGASALVTNNYSPAFDFNGFAPKVVTYSQNLATSGTAGVVTSGAGTLTLDGNGETGLLRFDVPATALTGALTVSVVNVASTQPLIINVTGATSGTSLSLDSVPVLVTYNDVPADHVAVNGTAPTTTLNTYPWDLRLYAFTGYATRILWNFNSTGTINLTGSDQWVGSIVAPGADLTTSQSINGRVYVGGDLTIDGDGNEIHNFPWAGCTQDATGSFTIAKAVTGAASGSVPGDTEFSVNYTVNGTPASTPLVITADGSVVNGPTLTAGDVVVFTEATAPTVSGVDWGAVTIRVDGSPTNTLTIADGGNATVVVTNTANSAVAATGSFTIAKAVTGAAAGSVPGATPFSVNYTVNGVPASTPLVITADGSVVNGPTLTAGDVVVFTEATAPTVSGVDWGAVTIRVDGSPTNTLTIADGGNATVVVTNTASILTTGTGSTDGVIGYSGDGGLAFTGAAGVQAMVAGALVLMAAGLILSLARRRSRS